MKSAGMSSKILYQVSDPDSLLFLYRLEDPLRPLELTSNEGDILRQVYQHLQIFVKVAQHLSSSTYPTLSSQLPYFANLASRLEERIEQDRSKLAIFGKLAQEHGRGLMIIISYQNWITTSNCDYLQKLKHPFVVYILPSMQSNHHLAHLHLSRLIEEGKQ